MRSASEIWESGGDGAIRDALTELYAYVLVLDAELHRTDDRLAELDRSGGGWRQLGELRRRRAVLSEQLGLLSRTINALRSATDPTGRYL